MYHTYYKLSDGEIIFKERIDAAIALLNRLIVEAKAAIEFLRDENMEGDSHYEN